MLGIAALFLLLVIFLDIVDSRFFLPTIVVSSSRSATTSTTVSPGGISNQLTIVRSGQDGQGRVGHWCIADNGQQSLWGYKVGLAKFVRYQGNYHLCKIY